MASKLPLSLQDRILHFAGSPQAIPLSIPIPTPPSGLAQPMSTARPSSSQPSTPLLVPTGPRLSPSDLFVLNADDGPGFIVLDQFLGAAEADAVAAEARAHGGLRPAGMGRGLGKWSAQDSRGDAITWLHETDSAAPHLQALLRAMRVLGDSMAASSWGGNTSDGSEAQSGIGTLTGRLSHQLARYPGDGTGYVRHRDAYPASVTAGTASASTPGSQGGAGSEKEATRRLTAIYYLNEAWVPEHGGQLRLYNSNGTGHWDVEPLLDRLVVFRADRVDHEVLPAFHERFAMTTWFYGHAPQLKATSQGEAKGEPAAVTSVDAEAAAPAAAHGTSTDVAAGTPQSKPLGNMNGITGETWPHLPVATAAVMSHVSVTCAGDGGGPHPCIKDRPPLPSLYAASAAPSAAANRSDGSSSGCGSGNDGSSRSTVDVDGAGDEAETGTIFVSIASFRDSECQHTLRDLFETALYPNRVFVGVVGQYDSSEDTHCFMAAPLPEKWAQQVRCLSIPAADARGPCWARHWAAQLHKGEMFYLQIDSHMRFRPNWDSYLISCLAACPSSRPVLTAYPPAYTLLKEGSTSESKLAREAAAAAVARPIGHAVVASNETRATLLCPTEFGAEGALRQTGKVLKPQPVNAPPLPSLLWAAGFSFCRASPFLQLVPYDPHLLDLFFGEEPTMAARLWTHGFDCFAPPQAVCYHLWTRDHRPVFKPTSSPDPVRAPPAAEKAKGVAEQKLVESARSKSQRRMRQLLGIAEGPPASCSSKEDRSSSSSSSAALYEQERFGPYGLGQERTFASFETALGVRFGPGPEPNNEVEATSASSSADLATCDSCSGSSSSSSSRSSTSSKNWWRPAVIRSSAKWGGQPPEIFNENDNNNAALLLALSQAMGF